MTPAQATLARSDRAALEEHDFHWRAAVRDRFASMELRRKEWVGSFGSFRIRDLGDLLITDWECPPVEGVRGNNLARRDDDALLVITASAGETDHRTRGSDGCAPTRSGCDHKYPGNGELRHPRPPDQTNHQSAHDGARLVRYG